MAKMPDSIRVKVEVDLGEEEMLDHLRNTWGTAGLIRRALGPVPHDQVESVLAVATRQRVDDLAPSTPYADEPLRPEQPHPGQRHLDLLETVDERWGQVFGLAILLILLATIALLLVT